MKLLKNSMFIFQVLFVLVLSQACLAQEQQKENKKDTEKIYTWRDEQGVLHMQDTKPEHLTPEQSRMEHRKEYLEKKVLGEPVQDGSALPGRDTEQVPDDRQSAPVEQGMDTLGRPGGLEGGAGDVARSWFLAGTFGIAIPAFAALLLYVLGGYVLYRVGSKFGVGKFWGYLIPFYNVVLLCRCAELTPWFMVFLFFPIINLFVAVLIWGKIAERLDKNMVLWGLMCALLALPVLVLAFDSSMPVKRRKESVAPEHIAL